MTCGEAPVFDAEDCGLGSPAETALRCSKRRAHLGGRSVEGNTHGMLARRQLEHGDNLSHRTLRRRQTVQLRGRGFCAAEPEAMEEGGGAGGGGDVADGAGVFACFSEAETEAWPRLSASGLPPIDDMLKCLETWRRSVILPNTHSATQSRPLARIFTKFVRLPTTFWMHCTQ